LLIAKLLGLLAGAVQWLPTWDLLAESQRQVVDSAFAHYGSLHPLNLLQLLAPYLFETRVAGGNTHELALYVGAVPLMLVVWMLQRRNDIGNHARFLKFALALTCIAFALALGKYGGVYVLQTWLPLVGKFRLPARYLVLVYFGVASLSAVALDHLLRQPAERDSGDSRLFCRLAVASLALAVVGPWLWSQHVASARLICTGPVLIAAAAAAVMLARRKARGALAVLVALAAIDLGLYGFSYAIFPNAVSLSDYAEAAAVPPLTTGYRIATDLPAPQDATVRGGNRLILSGCRQIDGYAGLEPRKQLDYRQLSALQAAGVQWVANRPHTRKIAGLLEHDDRWLEVPNPLPRVRLEGPREETHHAQLVHETPGELHIALQTPQPRLLVIAESFHRGWRAQIDGHPAELQRVHGDFMGCLIEPGEHDVRLVFRPASLVWGRRLSIAGVLGIALLFTMAARPRSMHRDRLELHHSNNVARELAHV
jgi:hypothetical protein